jgi:hypothetical protein
MNIQRATTIALTILTLLLLSLATYTWQVVERGRVAGGVLFIIVEVVAYFGFLFWINKTLKESE